MTARLLTRYKAWANEITYAAVAALPEGEALRQRPTRFGNMVHTLNHVYVIDSIFRAHLEEREHGYKDRNTDQPMPFDELREAVRAMDAWYIDLADRLSASELSEEIEFRFVSGELGRMTREAMILHVVNHATYHRGFVGDMLYQVPAQSPANDLTVYLRDVAGAQAYRAAMDGPAQAPNSLP